MTLPLSRYYAANKEKLPVPFKVIQTDRVYRAERPQKGRWREFVQCDIDILGDDSLNAEVELIDVTARALMAIGFSGFTVNVNDRRLLRGMLQGLGFEKEALDSVCISFDKLDKIGPAGVAAELREKGFAQTAVAALEDFLAKGAFGLDEVAALCEDKALSQNVRYVLQTARAAAKGAYAVEYNPSLVRGQGYYTGMVFEVTCAEFSGAVAGGGRYDDMVGKFLGQKVPAVGFSIGFERICAILLSAATPCPRRQSGWRFCMARRKILPACWKRRLALRGEYEVTVLAAAKKLGKQYERLAQRGFAAACLSEKYPEIKPFT